ncbi:MAG: hypothetical protein ACI4EF_07600 [Coprococcus sp.]
MRKKLMYSIVLLAMGICMAACGKGKNTDSENDTKVTESSEEVVADDISEAEEETEKGTEKETTEAVTATETTTEEVTEESLSDNVIIEDFNIDDIIDYKATINVPEGFELEKKEYDSSVTYKNSDGVYFHVFFTSGTAQDYINVKRGLYDNANEKNEDISYENETGTVTNSEGEEYLYFSGVRTDASYETPTVTLRIVGFSRDIYDNGNIKGCIAVEFYNYYEDSENNELVVDDLKNILSEDGIKLEKQN